MPLLPKLVVLSSPDCLNYPCKDACCGSGCDVWPHERAALLQAGLATEADFVDPYANEGGDGLFRTALGPRGCIFLKLMGEDRGCRLHGTGLKPDVCVIAWASPASADAMFEAGYLPCRAEWTFGEG